MVEDDERVRGAPSQRDELVHLVVVVPALVDEPAPAEQPHAVAERLLSRQPGAGRPRRVLEPRAVRAARERMADPAQAAAAGGGVRVQHLGYQRPQRQVGEGDDAGDLGAGAVRRRARDRFHPLGLAHRPQMLGTAAAVVGPALDEHGLHHVMAAVHVGVQVFQQVGAAFVAAPQVVVRIDDPDWDGVSESSAPVRNARVSVLPAGGMRHRGHH